MHMAAALDRKIVAIFGAGLVPFCHPLCSKYLIVKHELGCSGCNDICFTDGVAPCITLVTVDMVLEAIQTLLNNGC
jgi:ADP-heptose:LPS heptosyltransferase